MNKNISTCCMNWRGRLDLSLPEVAPGSSCSPCTNKGNIMQPRGLQSEEINPMSPDNSCYKEFVPFKIDLNVVSLGSVLL